MYSVSQLWEWLTEDHDEFKGLPIGQYLAGCTGDFKGRTPSYESFQEIEEDGEKVLKVYYTASGFFFYRRANTAKNRFHAEELGIAGCAPYCSTEDGAPYCSAWGRPPS